MTKNRLLFIDILKIVGIILIIAQHLNVIYKWLPNDAFLFNTTHYFIWNFGTIGVMLFLIASGSSLALSNRPLGTLRDIADFYQRRVLRIYPAYWAAVILALFELTWMTKSWGIFQYFETFSGFQYAFNDPASLIVPYWFVGLIIALYLMYPALYFLYDRCPAIVVFTLTTCLALFARYLLYHGTSFSLILIPLEYMLYFTIGIFLVKVALYPDITVDSLTICFLADLSFYVYLVHAFMIYWVQDYLILCIVTTILLSIMLMFFDREVHTSIELFFTKKNHNESP